MRLGLRVTAQRLTFFGVLLALACLTNALRAQAQQQGVVRHFSRGWNLVALPPGVGFLDINGLYSFQPGDRSYEAIAPGSGMQAGYGYWAFFVSDIDILLPAGNSTPYTVSAPPGQYVMIGDPSGLAPATVTGADAVFVYATDTGYQRVSTLQPGQGAWAVSLSGGQIVVTPVGATAAATATTAPARDLPATATLVPQPRSESSVPASATPASGSSCSLTRTVGQLTGAIGSTACQ